MSASVGASLRALRRFVRPRGDHRCELCRGSIAPDPGHRHLLEVERDRTLCVCEPCALLFDAPSSGRYRAVPRTLTALPELVLSEADWQALGVPVRLAFFVRDDEREEGGRAVYPSALGGFSARLGPEAFALLEEKCPRVGALMPRVEALLVSSSPERERAYLAPIDVCYRLLGVLRASAGAPSAVGRFFEELDERARRAHGT